MIGDIFGGVSNVAWSPDLELLVVVSTNGQLLLMRENFSTIIEQPVETESLGEKSAITVGWGSFHLMPSFIHLLRTSIKKTVSFDFTHADSNGTSCS